MEARRAVTVICLRRRPTCPEMLGHTNWSALGLLLLLVCPSTEGGLYPRLSGLERVLLRRGGNLTGLLALLAPLAALPLIAGTALPLSMAPLLAPAMSTVLGRRRRRRDLLATFVGNNVRSENTSGRATTFCLHTSQEEQQQDEVLAGYLQCSGMLAADNHCLERLACQFSADALRGPLHKDVASL
ncbi:hypothetical protein HPB51_009752 [Rhipicephalus microplus]|uniref:Uncharacterized protein n=1 Tax=Rhipicephalus microplus TaxID=6941 RepID=A0A9J6F174_RHIMP|nr:hypothetical protein HPB51_009752 [Rhipicephalus microplus]